jgi:hypothetical protein
MRKRPNASVNEHSTARILGKSKNKVFTAAIMKYEVSINKIVAAGRILFMIFVRFSNSGVGFIRY